MPWFVNQSFASVPPITIWLNKFFAPDQVSLTETDKTFIFKIRTLEIFAVELPGPIKPLQISNRVGIRLNCNTIDKNVLENGSLLFHLALIFLLYFPFDFVPVFAAASGVLRVTVTEIFAVTETIKKIERGGPCYCCEGYEGMSLSCSM